MTTRTSPDAADRESAGLELSIWDALMLGRFSATGPGLRTRTPNVAPNPTAPVAHRKEAA